ncbi:unnamed protein product, partial [Discosporangium mesarthrocarpum]
MPGSGPWTLLIGALSFILGTVAEIEIKVSSYDNTVPGHCGRGGLRCNLRAAIAKIGARTGTIALPAFQPHTWGGSPIEVGAGANITIMPHSSSGKGPVVFSGGGSRLLSLTGGSLTVKRAAFYFDGMNPSEDGVGGSSLILGTSGSSLSMVDCLFQ